MAEEITREIIQEIIKETIPASSLSLDISWFIPTIALIVTIGGLAFSIYRYSETQRQHNKAQEKAQEQFNKTQEKSQNLEFMKQLEHYDAEILRVRVEFDNSPGMYNDCHVFAEQLLIILDRISYLKIKGLVNQDFVQYFQNRFNAGRTYLSWLKFTEQEPSSWHYSHPNFNEIKNTLDYIYFNVVMASPFYYYAHQINTNPEYNPKTDTFDPKTYNATKKDFDMIKPE